MADINQITNGALDQYAISNKQKEDRDPQELGKDEFLKLMIAQMNNQNPLEPTENGEFIAQLAQFSTVEGITNMADGFETLSASMRSSQALQASSLVGGAVTVDGETSSMLRYGDLVYGSAKIQPGSDNLRLRIETEGGEEVESVDLGFQPDGELNFKWNGMDLEVNGRMMDIDYDKFPVDEDGNPLPHPEGRYRFSLMGSVLGQNESLDVSMSSRVESVAILDGNRVQLNLDNGNKATLDQVQRINEVF
ncbi:MAG: flagellar hook assembly protein FlgD [Natronospirillum sp.]|uniref:flagellar hook assembly protein FlgD n=1 Tax=Natronospirillum sp. TaxID=2812955 RepID=UPI0025DB1489|nr:flagellar hook assembly protein FlgD [Natronospirillum sp.]MCH8552847.1 flagellar hook assembly protein FlgD [Natronospirillum sp.]